MASIQIDYKRVGKEALSPEEQLLVDQAIQAMDGAHAVYSNFTVGSAVLMADGSIVTGNNQENAAYPSGLCAERVALFAAKSQSKLPIQLIAIVARNQKQETADSFACGSCRQVMVEYANGQKEPVRVIMGDHTGQYVVLNDVRMLLPFSFNPDSLG